MTKKQTAAAVAAVLVALAGVLTQCPDDEPAPVSPPPPVKARADAGA